MAITFEPNEKLTAQKLNAALEEASSSANSLAAQLAAPTGAGLVGFQQPDAGAVPLSVATVLSLGAVFPEEYGATGNGVTDDSGAFAAAASTGKTIICSAKTYLLNAGFTLSTAGQRLLGQGFNSILKFVGNFDCITISTGGGSGGGIQDIRLDASSMTGGYVVVGNNATRLNFRNIRAVSGFNGIRFAQTNTTSVEQVQFENFRGTNVFYCDGRTQRSDGLRVIGVTLSGDGVAAPDLFTVDGFFNTIQAFGLVGIRGRRFISHVNTASTTVGNFARYYDSEGDVSNTEEQIRLEVGVDIHFTDLYSQGSQTTDGVFIANGVDLVSFKGGRITGHWMRGINNNGSRVKVVGTLIGGNSQAGSGQFSGVYCGPTAVKFNAAACETGINIGITPMQKFGFEVDIGATDCNWVGGSLKNNVTGEWIDNSGGVSGNVNVIGYSGISAPTTDAYLALVQANGGSTTIANDQPGLFLTSGVAVATYTVTMPPNPRDGWVVTISTRSAITTFTLNGNAGQTMNNAPTTLAAGEGHAWKWRAQSANWFRLY